MTLIDTSIWVEHFRGRGGPLTALLHQARVQTHPFVIGELMLGALPPSPFALAELSVLPQLRVARDDEVMRLIRARDLKGRGIGYVDAHLLAATILAGESLWTLDRKLRAAAEHLSLVVGP